MVSNFNFLWTDFEFRTIEKPERHKKEEPIPIQKIPEKRKSFDLPIKEEAKQLEEDHDQVFYDHIDRLMEEKLKINGPVVEKEDNHENGTPPPISHISNII